MINNTTLTKIITDYKSLFQDKSRLWLVCREDADFNFCRCLDCEQLNIAILWVNEVSCSNVEISFNCHAPYNIYLFSKNDNAKEENNRKNIIWCEYENDLHEEYHYIKDVKNHNNRYHNFMTFNRSELRRIFILLYIYNVNIGISRNKITIFYLAIHPNVFRKYITNLKEELSKHSSNLVSNDFLKTQIVMMKEIFHICESKETRENFFREIKSYKGLRCYGFKLKIEKNPLYRWKIERKLNKECYNSILDTNFIIDETVLENMYFIFNHIHTNNFEITTADLSEIYNSIKKMIEVQACINIPEIENWMLKIEDELKV